MSKRTVFTSITPLPSGISRQTAIAFLHDHKGMIDINPLVTKRHPIPPPKHALPEEHSCAWYAITDKVSYFPGGLVTGEVEYTTAFHDLPCGMQTHCYAPLGLDLRAKWTVGGTLPGEKTEPVELGLDAPPTGLYIREDVDMRCSVVMAGFVKKTLKRAHETAVETLIAKAQIRAKLRNTIIENGESTTSTSTSSSSSSSSYLIPPLRSDRPASWGGRDFRSSAETLHSYSRQAQERNTLMREQNMYSHPLSRPLY